MTQKNTGAVSAIEVMVSKQQSKTYTLKNRQRLTIKGKLGDSIIEIDNGKVRMISSPCNQKLCVLSGWHQHSGDSIVCLPNEVSVTLVSDEDRFDGVNF